MTWWSAWMAGDRPIDNLRRVSLSKSLIYYSMRLLPFVRVRRAIAGFAAFLINIGRPRPAQGPHRVPQAVEAVRTAGWTMLGTLLRPAEVTRMSEFLATNELVSPRGERFQMSAPPAHVRLASFPVRTVLDCPHVVELMNRPQILEIAASYLGCVPTISGLRIDWSDCSRTAGDTQRFHRDYDDWRFLKLFIYLTDVDDDSGPHEFVATSHLQSGRLRARPYEREELVRTYGEHNLVRVRGAAGTSFMVDTWGIHKGNVPLARFRLMLQVQYSVLPVLRFDYQPLPIALPAHANRFSNRLLVAS